MQARPKFVPVVIVNGREQVGNPTSYAAANEYVNYARGAGFLATLREHRPELERAARKASARRFSGELQTGFGSL